jgi:hypothetical protein
MFARGSAGRSVRTTPGLVAGRPWGAARAAIRPQLSGQRSAGLSSSRDDPMGSLLELRAALGKQNVKYLLPSYVDMHGIPKSKVVPLSHMMNMMGGSEMFTGAALEGVVRPSPAQLSIPLAQLLRRAALMCVVCGRARARSLKTCQTQRYAASRTRHRAWCCPGSLTQHGSPPTSVCSGPVNSRLAHAGFYDAPL